MKPRLLHTATAVLAATLLLVSCSGDSDSGDDIDGLQTADDQPTDDPTSETPNPTPTDDGIDRPEIELPQDLELIVEEVDSDDPVEQAILFDHEQRVATKYEAMAEQSLETPGLAFYTTDEALDQLFGVLEEVLDQGIYAAGTARYFNRDVTVFDNDRAALSYCRDASGVYDVDTETGETVSEADPDEAPTLYETEVARNDEGVWQETSYSLESGAGECQ